MARIVAPSGAGSHVTAAGVPVGTLSAFRPERPRLLDRLHKLAAVEKLVELVRGGQLSFLVDGFNGLPPGVGELGLDLFELRVQSITHWVRLALRCQASGRFPGCRTPKAEF